MKFFNNLKRSGERNIRLYQCWHTDESDDDFHETFMRGFGNYPY